MIRKCARLSKIAVVIGLLNLLIYIHYITTTHTTKEIIPSCYQQKDEQCELQLYITLQKVTSKILTMKSIFPKKDYEKVTKFERFVDSLVYRAQKIRESRKATKMLKFSCGETYNGTTFGYPYFIKGFMRINCNRPPITQSTSLILESPAADASALHSMLKYGADTFHGVFVILHEDFKDLIRATMSKLSHSNIEVLLIGKELNLGKALNDALKRISTPLVLLASHLAKLDAASDIERLINVQEISGASIVGAAVKDYHTGEWDRSCYQTETKVYTLKYFPGYYTSQNECLSCSYIGSPFIAETRFLKRFLFRELSAGVYRDLFLRLEVRGDIVSCPDVMFYVNSKRERAEDLVEFANTWDISRIHDTDGKVLWFGCRRGFNYTKKESCSMKRTFIVPPDCRANLLDVIIFILNLCLKHNILCELQEGTLLGAMKFNNILPWERDADLTVLSQHFDVLKNLSHVFEAEGYKVNIISEPYCCFEGVVSGGVMNIHAHGWTVEVYGQHKLTSLSNARTKVRLGRRWVHTPENPGLYARNRYGREIYNHAEHWLSTGKDSGWAFYNSGAFHVCEEKGHHACLDQFKGDGDIQFYQWL